MPQRPVPPVTSSRIIRFLRNEYDFIADWNGEAIHQQDLTTMLRVNSEIHALTAPVLYSAVIVKDMDAFLRGLEICPSTPYSEDEPPRVLNKVHLMSKIKRINFILPSPTSMYSAPPNPDSISLVSLSLESADDHTRFHDIVIQFIETTRCWVSIFRNYAGRFAHESHSALCPELRNVTFGTGQPAVYESLLAHFQTTETSMRIQYMAALNSWCEIILSFQPRHICQRNIYGPHSFPAIRRMIDSSLFNIREYSTHISLPGRFAYMKGIRNVIYIGAPPFILGYIGVSVHLLEFIQLVRKERGDPSRGTKIELYGAFRGFEGENEGEERKEEWVSYEEKAQRLHLRHVLSGVDESWRKVIIFGLWEDRPACEGCDRR